MNIKLDIFELKSGMVLAEDIYDRDGRLLLPKNTIVSNDILNILINTSYKKHIYINVGQNFVNIKPIIEFPNGEQQEINHEDIKLPEDNERIIIHEKFQEMHDTIRSSFDKLSLNNTSEEVKKELENTVTEIENNLTINAALLNEILDVKAIDEYLYNHSLNVSVISSLIGKWMNLSHKDLNALILAGLVHDIGKLRINPLVLNKAGRLSEEEFEEIKKHPVYTHKMLTELGYKNFDIIRAVTLHHEKEDGSGYPLGLTGDKIPLYAKILAIADIFDAMTSNRVYKERVSPFKVLEMFQNQTFGQLDYLIVITFIKKFLEYYVGSEVVLSNNQKTKIISLNIFEITKPLLVTFDGEFIDISKNRNVKIIDFSEKFYKI